MNRLMIPAIFALTLCPLLAAQEPGKAADAPQPSAVAERDQAIKSARTICIKSETAFITVSTFDRALMRQKNWDRLGLNIVANPDCHADLQIDVDRLIFTHIHTYVLTDTSTKFVLASGRVTAFDGIVASGPMAGQIVKILSAARLPVQAAEGDHGL